MEYRQIKQIKELPNNPRTIKGKQFDTLCKSIKDNPEYFEARPLILSDRTGDLIIIAGNQRYKAAKHLKLETVPTFLIKWLTEEKEREIIIRDNVSNWSWDYDILANSYSAEELGEWWVDLPEMTIEDDEEETEEWEEVIELTVIFRDLQAMKELKKELIGRDFQIKKNK